MKTGSTIVTDAYHPCDDLKKQFLKKYFEANPVDDENSQQTPNLHLLLPFLEEAMEVNVVQISFKKLSYKELIAA